MIRGLLGLYRLDAFVRFFLLYLLGCYVATEGSFVLLPNLAFGMLIAGVSIHFVYALNAWADADIDAINKPYRSIPAGRVTRVQALGYSLVLLIGSMVYPLVMFGFSETTALLLWLPLAGILYSNPLYPFKRKRFLALFTIISAVVVTVFLGYELNGGIVDARFVLLALLLVLSFAALIPMKDLSDMQGDQMYGADNWFNAGSVNWRFGWTALLFIPAIFVAWYSEIPFAFFLVGWSGLAFVVLALLYKRGFVFGQRFYFMLQLSWLACNAPD